MELTCLSTPQRIDFSRKSNPELESFLWSFPPGIKQLVREVVLIQVQPPL
jgi:hypothetical protein